MANWYINYGNGSSTGYFAVAVWTINTPYVSTSNGGRGDYVRQTSAVGTERVFRCTTSGTSHGSTEPTWTTTKNGTTNDLAPLVWTECTGAEADQGPAASVWTAPHARLGSAFSWGAANDVFYISSNHSETTSSALTLTPPGNAVSSNAVYCVTQTTVPPTSANLTTGASITTTGNSAISIASTTECYFRGVAFSCGTGNNTALLSTMGNSGTYIYENCSFASPQTSTSKITMGGNGGLSGLGIYNNCTLTFGAAGQQLNFTGGTRTVWKNTANAIAGTTPTILINTSGVGGTFFVEGVDLSALGSGKTIVAAGTNSPTSIHFKDCLLGASVVVAGQAGAWHGVTTLVSRSSSAATNYVSQKYNYMGTSIDDTTVYRTSGASDGTTARSWKITTQSVAKWLLPFESTQLAIWNPTALSAVVATVYGVINAAAVPNNDEIWIDVEYLGSSTSPLGSYGTSGKADGLATGSPTTASTQAWSAGLTARQNTHAYTAGDIIGVSSNASRIFFCTTSGTSAGSEPTGVSGYSSAVDGGSVTDNTAVFRAGCRFAMAATLSPQPGLVGYLYATVKVAKATTTYYVDPLIVLSAS